MPCCVIQAIIVIVTYSLIVLVRTPTLHNITCQDVMEMPTDKRLPYNDLTSLSPIDLLDCLPHLARQPMTMAEADYIWKYIIKIYGDVSNVPDEVLKKLHWVTPAIEPEEYGNISINSIEVVRNFGLDYGLNEKQLEAIAQSVRDNFSRKRPEDYTFYDLKALGQILCVLNKSEIERIHPSTYRETASIIGRLNNCDAERLSGFANLAVHKDAFGPSENWTPSIVNKIGKVAEFVPKGLPKALVKKDYTTRHAEQYEKEENEVTHEIYKTR